KQESWRDLHCLLGSQAFILRDDPDSKLALISEELKEYLSNIARGVNEKVDWIPGSALGRRLLARIYDGFSNVRKSLHSLQAELPAEVTQAFNMVVGVPWGLGKRVLNTLSALTKKVMPASQEASEEFYSVLAPYTNTVLEQVGQYTEALHYALTSARTRGLTPKLIEQLKQQLGELKTQLSPYDQKLLDQLQELQEDLVEPITDQAQERFSQGVEKFNQRLQSFLAPILNTLQEYTKDCEKWVDLPAVSQGE
ncbi:hypothetical protein lerEdw1_009915, partial [Lerista edwardsae]